MFTKDVLNLDLGDVVSDESKNVCDSPEAMKIKGIVEDARKKGFTFSQIHATLGELANSKEEVKLFRDIHDSMLTGKEPKTAHRRRAEVVRALMTKPMTNTQLADELNWSYNSICYPVNFLVKEGVIAGKRTKAIVGYTYDTDKDNSVLGDCEYSPEDIDRAAKKVEEYMDLLDLGNSLTSSTRGIDEVQVEVAEEAPVAIVDPEGIKEDCMVASILGILSANGIVIGDTEEDVEFEAIIRDRIRLG